MQQRPGRGPVAVGHAGQVEIEHAHELGPEPVLERRDRHVPAVGAPIGAVIRGAAVEQVGAALLAPPARGEQPVREGEQRADAVHHRRVDHLPAPARGPLHERGEHPHQQEHAAAAVVAHEVERGHGVAARGADGGQRPGQREVVEVVAGAGGERSVLAPAGHAGVDEPRVAGRAGVGPEAQPLRHTGAEALDEHVGHLRQAQRRLDTLGPGEIERDAAAPAVHRPGRGHRPGAGAVDPQHVGAEVGEHHPGMRHRPDAGELEDPDPRPAVPYPSGAPPGEG